MQLVPLSGGDLGELSSRFFQCLAFRLHQRRAQNIISVCSCVFKHTLFCNDLFYKFALMETRIYYLRLNKLDAGVHGI